MIAFTHLLKFLSEALGIIIVVACVIVFSYFDPFGWFAPKAKIDSTAILVKEVKQIGEIITAEYYGEAITSWPATAVENALQEDTVEIIRMINGIANDFQKLNSERNAEEWTVNRRMRHYRNNIKDKYASSPLYKYLMEEISTMDLKPAKKNSKEKFWKHEEKAVGIIYEKSPAEVISMIRLDNISKSATLHSKAVTKKDAACIGRGIVRAGFDFSKLVSEDIHLSETSRTIFITNATPKILSVELNPWFIPQRKVKGFEILNLQGRIDETDIRKLKTRCKEMIRQQAEARKIVAEAKRNGEEALFNFFTLVSKDPVNQVVIVSDYLDEMRFLFDTVKVFSPSQALDIYNKSILYLKDSSYSIPKPDSLKGFLKKLKSRNSQIDYAFGIKDSLHQVIDKKIVRFSLTEIESLRKSDLKLDTTRLIQDARKRDEFVEEFWNRL